MLKSIGMWTLMIALGLVGLNAAAGCHDGDDRDHNKGGYWNSQEQHQIDKDTEGREGDHNGSNNR